MASRREGFTLIELLVVVAIIALLISMLMPALGRAMDAARDIVCQSQMRQIMQGANMYALDEGSYFYEKNLWFDRDGNLHPGEIATWRWLLAEFHGFGEGSTGSGAQWDPDVTTRADVFECPSARHEPFARPWYAGDIASHYHINTDLYSDPAISWNPNVDGEQLAPGMVRRPQWTHKFTESYSESADYWIGHVWHMRGRVPGGSTGSCCSFGNWHRALRASWAMLDGHVQLTNLYDMFPEGTCTFHNPPHHDEGFVHQDIRDQIIREGHDDR